MQVIVNIFKVFCFKSWVVVLPLLVALQFAFISPLFASKEHFRHYTIEDGLSNNAVYSIFQDSRQMMWFGTIDGLHCFDGQKIKPVKWGNKELLPGSIIYSIAEDTDKCLWIASDNGVSIYSLPDAMYLPFDFSTKEGVSIISTVSGIIIDQEIVWIATVGQGVFKFNTLKKELEQVCYPKIPSNYLTSVKMSRDGNIWWTAQGVGLLCFDKKSNDFKTFNDSKVYESSVLFEDSMSNLWVGTLGNGLFLFDRAAGEYKQIIAPPKGENMLQIRDIVEYNPGELIIASDNGIIKYNILSKQKENIREESEKYGGLNDNYVHSLYIDNERGLWIGTYFGGVNYLSPTQSNFSYYSHLNSSFKGKIISAFAKDAAENLWIGTDDAGFFYWDRKNNSFREYFHSSDGTGPTYRNVHALLPLGDKLLIGMYMGGLDLLDLNTGHFTNFNVGNSDSSLYSSGVYSLYRDNYGIIWVGTSGGLNKFDPKTYKFERVKEVKGVDIADITEDKGGNLWLSTLGGGVFCLNRKDNRWYNYLYDSSDIKTPSSNRVFTAAVDYNNDLWFGTDGEGVFKYNFKNGDFERCSVPGMSSKVIYKIIPDNDFLWISSSNGLVKWDPIQNVTKVYNKYDGLQDNQFSPNAGVKMSDGTIYFGGINGYNGFKPAEMVQNNSIPPVVFTEFYINNKSVAWHEGESPLIRSISHTDKLTLHKKHNVVSFDFAVLSYTGAKKNKYKYILEGFDNDWNYLDDNPHITYTNLPAGNYVLRASGANGDGVWNHQGIAIDIKVMPPLLLSIPFIIGYVFIVLIIIGYIFYYSQNKLRRQHKQKLAMLEAEKERELYNSKINFFANIVHEIRTPLTLILAPLESVMRSKDRVEDVLPQLNVIENNGKRLLSLVNQLMDFRKIEGGGMEVHCSNIEIISVIENIYKRFKLSAELKSINMELSVECSKCVIFTDKEAFTKIMSNLLSNAIKFTKDTINISVSIAGNNLKVSIIDNGKGIDVKEQENIFKPFYQIKEESPSDYIGTGIGLLLVRKLADMIDARIELKSESGSGTEFAISFDIVSLEDAGLVTDDYTSSDIILPNEVNNIKSLLVVDDNADMLSFIKSMFDVTFKVFTASDGMDAIKKLEHDRVDIIISDIMMPNMDGYEFCSKVKNNINTSHIPIILLTAKVEVNDRIMGLDYGADAYIEKPFSQNLLIKQVENLLLNRERLREIYLNSPAVPFVSVANSDADKIFIEKLEKIISDNISEDSLSVDFIAKEVGMGRTNFFSKVKDVSGVTPNDYIRIARLKRAAKFFIEGEDYISEVCYRVGFSSPSYFSKCFQNQFGISPTDYVKNLKQNKKEH